MKLQAGNWILLRPVNPPQILRNGRTSEMGGEEAENHACVVQVCFVLFCFRCLLLIFPWEGVCSGSAGQLSKH